ncbi:MAG TPA: ATP-binding protein [Gammaproteobacteria bacterium]|nr:ATP-binding protein [Gammaproteobacteria bacterium]
MFRLFTKYLFSLCILAIIAGAGIYWIYQSIQERGSEQVMQQMYRGGFYSLQQQLMHYPEASWPTIIKQLQPEYGTAASILPLSDISLSDTQKQRLLAGEFVLQRGGVHAFFGYEIQDLFLYQRIGLSHYALRMQDVPIQVVARPASAWMTQLIILELSQTPRKKWPEKLQQLQANYGLPLAIIPANTVSPSVYSALQHDGVALSDANNSGEIKYLYANLPKQNSLLQIGPISYPAYMKNYWGVLLLFFIFLTLVFIILLTYLFSRSLNSVYKLTEQFSQADFSIPPKKVSRHSTLRQLYDNILKMGNRIQNLIQSQRNLTRFIAHECRTPISTMLFTVNSMEQENLSEKAQQDIISLKEDLSDLNNLVSDFLNYARFSAEEYPLHYKNVDINQWLAAVISKYRQAPKKMTLDSQIPAGILLTFDSELMKHMLCNLINNGLKHADSQVELHIEQQNSGCIIIHVDDDGTAIDDADKTHIFSPFVTLESNTPGFGLGLAIADIIVKRHNGKLLVSDSPLGGARFSVVLNPK